jgi:hypothetical protein
VTVKDGANETPALMFYVVAEVYTAYVPRLNR